MPWRAAAQASAAGSVSTRTPSAVQPHLSGPNSERSQLRHARRPLLFCSRAPRSAQAISSWLWGARRLGDDSRLDRGEPLVHCLVTRVRQETRPQRQEHRPAGSRRPGPPRLRHQCTEPAVAARHHRTPHDPWKAVSVHGPGRLLHQIADDSTGARMKSRLAATALTNAVARRDEVAGCVVHTDRLNPISFVPGYSLGTIWQVDGSVRCRGRHCGHGELFRTIAEQHFRPAHLDPPARNRGPRSCPVPNACTTVAGANRGPAG